MTNIARPTKKLKTKNPSLYVPQNFNAAALLPTDLKRYANEANYLIHLLVRARVTWRADADGFIKLKVEYLRNVIPKNVEKPLREALIAAGVIECRRQFIIGRQSMRYRLTPAYCVPARRIACDRPRLAAKIIATRDPEFRSDVRLPVHHHLRHWIRRVRIDVEQAESIVYSTPDLLPHADLHMSTVAMINDGQFDFMYCAMGRVHTNVARLAGELRPALRIGNEPLVNIDVRSCQPLLLGLLLSQYHAQGPRLIDPRRFDSPTANPYTTFPTLNREDADDCAPTSYKISSVITPLLPPSPCPPPSPPPADRLSAVSADDGHPHCGRHAGERPNSDTKATAALSHFLRLCENGGIYDYMLLVSDLTMNRAAFKHLCFRVLFGKAKFDPRNDAFNRLIATFDREFPLVMQLAREVKTLDRKFKHALLARVAQNLESSLMIGNVCHGLMRDHPHVPLVTIHDSIMTTPEYVDLVAGRIRDGFEQVGVRPSLKIERLTETPAAQVA